MTKKMVIGSLACLLAAIALHAASPEIKQKKFLTKPLVIEDQGSFFIGGVQKVTNLRHRARARIRRPPPARSPSARCTCSSKFRRARKRTCRR